MKSVRNLKVGMKLILTFSIILVLFILASVLFMIQSNEMMKNFTFFYDHPYLVSNTSREVKSEILSIWDATKDIVRIRSLDDIDIQKSTVSSNEEKALSNIKELKGKFLGPADNISSFETKFIQWEKIESEVVALAKDGKPSEAALLSIGDGNYAKDMLLQLDTIISLENDRAKMFYEQAIRAHNSAETMSYAFLAASLLVSVLLAFLLTKSITSPIGAIMEAIRKVRDGEEAAVVATSGRKDELGVVSEAFNGMLAYMKSKKELEELAMTLKHQKSLEQFRVTLLSIGDAVISTDMQGYIVNMNPVAEQMTGWSQEEAAGLPAETVFHIINAQTQMKAENPLKQVLELGCVVGLANHTVLISRTGQWRHISDSAAPIRDADGQIFGVVLVFRDVSEEYRKQEEIFYMSFHDKLTGLYNRAFFEEEIKRMNSARQMPLSIIMGDINGLKLINDAFGHYEGDKYLMAAANALHDNCRSEDVVARWGGDEFVILLPKTGEEDCQRISGRITEAYGAISGFRIKPSIALGFAVQTDVKQDYQKTLKEAETNMYRHKLLDSHSVRNAIVATLDSSMNERSYETEEHEKALVKLCNMISATLGLKERDRDELGLLAKLHDIGKIAISDTILLKPGELDEDEWVSMKKHTEIGYRMAKALNELEHIAEGILSHHERWDGTGYPRSISGEKIPLNARIIAVADAYDVMTRGRPYRAAISHEEAIAELKRCSGTQFDPRVVDGFLQALENSSNHEHPA